MEEALCAIRLYATGRGSEQDVFRCARSVAGKFGNASADPVIAAATVTERQEEEESEIVFEIQEDEQDYAGASDVPSAGLEPFASRTAGAEVTERQSMQEVTELFTWGQSAHYQLGCTCHQAELLHPRSVPLRTRHSPSTSLFAQIKTLSCGRFHSVAVASCGSVFSWGFGGTCFSLGLETHEDITLSPAVLEPTQLPEFGPGRNFAVKAAAGMNHSLVLVSQGANNGKILAWGSNSHGQLGIHGAPVGPDAHVKRPSFVKASLKNEDVLDIAAGAEHSLCVASGGVFAWGSNVHGSLGLGLPPAGPSEAAVPQQLPHLRGALGVAASSTGHVSIAIASHGDAVIFGSAPPAESRGGAAGRSGPAASSLSKYSLPSRVRRRESKGAGEDEEWLTQRGTAATLPPLQSVAIGVDDAFGVDSTGKMWSWPLRGPRPCVADALVLAAAPYTVPAGVGGRTSSSPTQKPIQKQQLPTQGWKEIACNTGLLWATDRSAAASLWRLRRTTSAEKASGESAQWLAERSEYIDQVSSIACGPDHQAAIVRYWRPLPVSSPSGVFVVAAEDGDVNSCGEESDDDNVEEKRQPLAKVPSLQQMCEDRLLQAVTPRSFTLLCEIAWEFRRPELLDSAYAFFKANAPFLFTRTNLPHMAQLPLEVLAAFELTTSGILANPSAALDMDPWDFPPEEWRADPAAQPSGFLAETGIADAAAGMPGQSSTRKRRRGGRGSGSSSSAAKAASPKAAQFQVATSPTPGASPSASASKAETPKSAWLPPTAIPAAAASPALLPAAATSPGLAATRSPKVSAATSLSAACESASTDQAWIGVTGRRKAGDAGEKQSLSAAYEAQSPQVAPAAASNAPKSPPTKKPTSPKLADFLRPKPPTIAYGASSSNVSVDVLPHSATTAPAEGAVAVGPSPALAAAVESAAALAKATGSPWVQASEPPEPAVSMREILAESKAPRRRGTSDDDPTGEKTRCYWGSDVMPSALKQNSVSIAEAQEQERVEQSNQKELAEIMEIEAMFAALEVAEREEEMELHGGSTASVDKAADDKSSRRAGMGGRGRNRGGKGVESGEKSAGKGGRKAKSGNEGSWREGWWQQRPAWNSQKWSEWWTSDNRWEASAGADKDAEEPGNRTSADDRNCRGRGKGSWKKREAGAEQVVPFLEGAAEVAKSATDGG